MARGAVGSPFSLRAAARPSRARAVDRGLAPRLLPSPRLRPMRNPAVRAHVAGSTAVDVPARTWQYAGSAGPQSDQHGRSFCMRSKAARRLKIASACLAMRAPELQVLSQCAATDGARARELPSPMVRTQRTMFLRCLSFDNHRRPYNSRRILALSSIRLISGPRHTNLPPRTPL